MKVELARIAHRPRPRNCTFALAVLLPKHANHLRDIAVATAIRVDDVVGGVPRQFDQQRSRPEAEVYKRRLSIRIAAVGEQHQCRALALKSKQTIGAIPAFR